MWCPECDERMYCYATDDRQEWCREEYHCEKCNKDFSRLTVFGYDGLVKSDEWETD
jgi:hypothetical protein